MIPELNHFGVLPPGVHRCGLQELYERFASNEVRTRLCRNGASLLSEMKQHGFVRSAIFGGSFVTNKQVPKDLDLLLEITRTFGAAVQRDPTLLKIFSDAFAKPLGLHVKPWTETAPANSNLLVAFQMPTDEDMRVRGMTEEDRKGVLRAEL